MLLAAVATAAMLLLAMAQNPPESTCRTSLLLVDSKTDAVMAGLIRLKTPDGRLIPVPGLLSRGQGLPEKSPLHEWQVVPHFVKVDLPRGKFTLEALSGLETRLTRIDVDLTGQTTTELTVPLNRFWRRIRKGEVSGNTHLHLMKLSRKESDRYLAEIPRADNLDVLFLSYLERAGADQEYISNAYTRDDLAALTRTSGVAFGNGEEHRHNFEGFGQGYGHVMLLNIDHLVQPVSIGPGIMKTGSDGIPLTRGIQQARQAGATAVWCHNVFGYEADPNWILGRLDAMNIYDGGRRAGFKERYYRLLNAGFKVPFSTGTDWFMYDFSRVYVRMDGPVTAENWLKALSAGRSYITNGPLFEFTVDDAGPGDTINLDRPTTLSILGGCEGRMNFDRVELIRNGEVIETRPCRRNGGHFLGGIAMELHVDEPCWFALRIPPPSLDPDDTSTPVNEFGERLFGHTSPVYVTVAGRSNFDPAAARDLLESMSTAQQDIREHGKFEDPESLARVLDVYQDATDRLNSRLDTP